MKNLGGTILPPKFNITAAGRSGLPSRGLRVRVVDTGFGRETVCAYRRIPKLLGHSALLVSCAMSCVRPKPYNIYIYLRYAIGEKDSRFCCHFGVTL